MDERPAADGPRRVRVVRRQVEAHDIVSFALGPADDRPLPAWSAGAHVDVHLPNGLVRQYSLFDSGVPGTCGIAVLREPDSRGGSARLHDGIAEGSVFAISAPRNRFPLVPAATRSILIAGGIGITPLLAMADELAAGGADFALHYCARSAARMAFRDRLAGGRYAARVRLHCDDGPPAQQFERDRVLATPGAGHHLYVCGPSGFIDGTVAAARVAGWGEDAIHFERFSGTAADGEARAFEVVVASTGRRVPVAATESVVEALAKIGIVIPVSCEQGVCGTCLTGIVQGEPDHRDLYLMPDERAAGRLFMPCCSRAQGDTLVLDL